MDTPNHLRRQRLNFLSTFTEMNGLFKSIPPPKKKRIKTSYCGEDKDLNICERKLVPNPQQRCQRMCL